MNWKPEFLNAIHAELGEEKDSFLQAHEMPPAVSVRFNPAKPFDSETVFGRYGIAGAVPWCSNAIYLHTRPVFTLEPLLHAGAFYVQEASSMFIHHALSSVFDQQKGLKALDLCAAPGGKSTLLASLPFFDTILANEIIQSRVGVLSENLVKWGSSHLLVSNNDPADVSRLGEQFDLVLTDAPCSGSGLFRKDEQAMDEWSPAAVELCAARQKRILQHAMSLVKAGGYLLYSTCSYAVSENEDNADFIMDTGMFTSLAVDIPEDWGIVATNSKRHKAHGYRFYPHRLSGEGFFCALFQKTIGGSIEIPEGPTGKTTAAAIGSEWLNAEQERLGFFLRQDDLFMLEKPALHCLREWSPFLKIRKSGLKMGTIIRGSLIPDHELAMSPMLNNELPCMSLDKDDAIRFLRRDDVRAEAKVSGWVVVRYEGQSLGWAKLVNGRVKNHYPVNWRILMQPR